MGCFVPGCKSGNSVKEKVHLLKISKHASDNTRQQWLKNIPIKKDKTFDFKLHQLCHLHFEEPFLIKTFKVLMGSEIVAQEPRKKWKLTDDAIPTKFSNEKVPRRYFDKILIQRPPPKPRTSLAAKHNEASKTDKFELIKLDQTSSRNETPIHSFDDIKFAKLPPLWFSYEDDIRNCLMFCNLRKDDEGKVPTFHSEITVEVQRDRSTTILFRDMITQTCFIKTEMDLTAKLFELEKVCVCPGIKNYNMVKNPKDAYRCGGSWVSTGLQSSANQIVDGKDDGETSHSREKEIGVDGAAEKEVPVAEFIDEDSLSRSSLNSKTMSEDGKKSDNQVHEEGKKSLVDDEVSLDAVSLQSEVQMSVEKENEDNEVQVLCEESNDSSRPSSNKDGNSQREGESTATNLLADETLNEDNSNESENIVTEVDISSMMEMNMEEDEDAVSPGSQNRNEPEVIALDSDDEDVPVSINVGAEDAAPEVCSVEESVFQIDEDENITELNVSGTMQMQVDVDEGSNSNVSTSTPSVSRRPRRAAAEAAAKTIHQINTAMESVSSTVFRHRRKSQEDTEFIPGEEYVPATPSAKLNKCHVCKKSAVCSIVIRQYGADVYLCSNSCFSRFRNQGNNSKSKTLPCSKCGIMEGDASTTFYWETMNFCTDLCVGRYQMDVGRKCCTCGANVSWTSLGKYCVRFGSDIRQFCTPPCLEGYKKNARVCFNCQLDIRRTGNIVLANIPAKNTPKEFCSNDCVEMYCERNVHQPTRAKAQPEHPCVMCEIPRPVYRELVLVNGTFRTCSESCWNGLLRKKAVANPSKCEMCSKFVNMDLGFTPPIYWISASNKIYGFCSHVCKNLYILNSRKIRSCINCKVKKYNYDLVEYFTTSTRTLNAVCSLACLPKSLGYLKNIRDVLFLPQLTSDGTTNSSNLQSVPVISAVTGSNQPTVRPSRQRRKQQHLPSSISNKATEIIELDGDDDDEEHEDFSHIFVKDSDNILDIFTMEELENILKLLQKPKVRDAQCSAKPKVKTVETQTDVSELNEMCRIPYLNGEKSDSYKENIESSSTKDTTNQTANSSKEHKEEAKETEKNDEGGKEKHTKTSNSIVVNEADSKAKDEVIACPEKPKLPTNPPEKSNGANSRKNETESSAVCPERKLSSSSDKDARRHSISLEEPIRRRNSGASALPITESLTAMTEVVPPLQEIASKEVNREVSSSLVYQPTGSSLNHSSPVPSGFPSSLGPTSIVQAPVPNIPLSAHPQSPGNYQQAYSPAAASSLSAPPVSPMVCPQVPHIAPIINYGVPASAPPTQFPHSYPYNAPVASGSSGISSNFSNFPSSSVIPPTPVAPAVSGYGVASPLGYLGAMNPPSAVSPLMPPSPTPKNPRVEYALRTWKNMFGPSDRLEFNSSKILSEKLCELTTRGCKPSGEKFRADMLLYISLGIQQILRDNKRADKIFYDNSYYNFVIVFTEYAERELAVGIHVTIDETHFWDASELGASSPGVMLFTLIYMFQKYFGLKTWEMHAALQFSNIVVQSRYDQFNRYVKYLSVVGIPGAYVTEVPEDINCPDRCLVKLYEFYCFKSEICQGPFYKCLRQDYTPRTPWFTSQPLDQRHIYQMLVRASMIKIGNNFS